MSGVLPWSVALAGRLDEHVIDSVVLRDNPLGDPARRPLWVYVPPGYDGSRQRYPSVYVIQGYTGHLAMWRNRSPYRQPFPETADAVFAAGDVPPALVVFVDAWTAYGGSQFVDSPGTGRYHSYLCEEVVPFVDSRYRTLAERAHRAISGKSSGGFGAMITPMLRPDLFGALASHAGDTLYELCYLAEFGKAVRHLRDYDGDIRAWWSDFRSRTAFTKPADESLLLMLGVSACFSARENGTPQLPFDPRTGVLISVALRPTDKPGHRSAPGREVDLSDPCGSVEGLVRNSCDEDRGGPVRRRRSWSSTSRRGPGRLGRPPSTARR